MCKHLCKYLDYFVLSHYNHSDVDSMALFIPKINTIRGFSFILQDESSKILGHGDNVMINDDTRVGTL